MRLLLLALAVLALPLSGCNSEDENPDSVDNPVDGQATDCISTEATATGSFSAATPGRVFSPTCFTLRFEGGFTKINAYEVEYDGFAIDVGQGVGIIVDGATPGTYEMNDDVGFTSASYKTGPETIDHSASGTVVLESVDGGAQGTFSFQTNSGEQITSGRFDLSL